MFFLTGVSFNSFVSTSHSKHIFKKHHAQETTGFNSFVSTSHSKLRGYGAIQAQILKFQFFCINKSFKGFNNIIGRNSSCVSILFYQQVIQSWSTTFRVLSFQSFNSFVSTSHSKSKRWMLSIRYSSFNSFVSTSHSKCRVCNCL